MVSVITVFVYSGDKVALIRRSDKVRTHRGKWAAFSGYLEDLPIRQARLELLEEAGLRGGDALLRGIGIPVTVNDPEVGDDWLVYPFLFELAGGASIRTDWESEEWGWFFPGDVMNMLTVPGLDRVLKSLWPPFGDGEFWDGMEDIAGNTEYGAARLGRMALEAMDRYVKDNDKKLDYSGLNRTVKAFAAVRPSMGVFPNLASRLMLAFQREGGEFGPNALISEMAAEIDDSIKLSSDAAADALAGKKRVFTLSSSESVRETLLKWYGRGCEVIAAESYPGGEGIELAEFLRNKGLNAETVRDEDMADAIVGSDAVMVGCDGIEGEMLQNKIGTSEAVSIARKVRVPAYAAAQTFKILPSGWPRVIELQGQGEQVFDSTPLKDFEAVYTEEGVLSRERLDEIRNDLDSAGLISA